MEQPQAIGRALGFGSRLYMDTATLGGLTDQLDNLKKVENISVVGCGSSVNAATYGAKLLKHSGVFTTVGSMDANSTSVSDFRVSKDPEEQALVLISQSGDTKEIVDLVQAANRKGVPLVGITNTVGSTLSDHTKCGVYTNAGEEYSAASTKSFTTQVVCLALVSMWFHQAKAKDKNLKLLSNEQKRLAEALQRLPITFGMLMRTQGVCKKAAKKLLNKDHCFVLGKGALRAPARPCRAACPLGALGCGVWSLTFPTRGGLPVKRATRGNAGNRHGAHPRAHHSFSACISARMERSVSRRLR